MSATGYEITCAEDGCLTTISGTNPQVVNETFRAHQIAVHNYMTGEEWNDRFERFYDPGNHDVHEARDALDAARKAAGIE